MLEAVSFIDSIARVMTGFFFRELDRLRDLLAVERLAEALREAAPLRAAEDRLTVALALLARRTVERFFTAVERFLVVPPVRRFAEAFPPRLADDFLLPLRFTDDFLLPPLRFADDFLLPDLVPDRFFFVAMCSPFDVRWGAVAFIEKTTDGNSVARSM